MCGSSRGPDHRDAEEEVQRHLRQLPQGDQDPAYLPTLTASRLRTTWIKDLLDNGSSLAEVQAAAGTTSASTLEAVVPFTKRRWADDEWLIIASGARSR